MQALTNQFPIIKTGLLAVYFLFQVLSAQAQEEPGACPQSFRYTFSWSLDTTCDFGPRGGTSEGPSVTLDPAPHPGWLALQEPGLSKKEKDRRAILAMAGPYRASFEFIETVGYTPDFERSRPYQSWGTEYIHVIEDSEDFISLQHIIVMFVNGEDGEVMGPFVQKHWRQDWVYEKTDILAYTGGRTWEHQAVSPGDAAGTWAQSVYQVDDSPRYESFGTWHHYANFSTWESADTLRPLPRRESSVRDDYEVLEGRNRHTIVPNGWVHEEENYKLKLTAGGEPAGEMPYLAKEQGVNRYERIVDFDFSAGDEYWELTSLFWSNVREVFAEFFAADDEIQVAASHEGVPLFAALFTAAEEAANDESGIGPGRNGIREIISPYIQ